MTEFSFKTEPYDFQRKIWNESRDTEGYALFLEMGCGKTKITLDTAAWLYQRGEIDALVVVAPNGVHTAWTADEVPVHMPEHITVVDMTWYTAKKNHVSTKQRLEEILDNDCLSVFVISYDAVMTEEGAKALKAVLTKRKCLYVLDESGRIKTPGAKRTKRILASAKYAKYRRILTGTPVDNSPFDVYTQVKFICPEIWQEMGIPNFGAFKTRYGIWQQRKTGNRQFPSLVRYINLPELHEIVDGVGSRLLKHEVLDLPPKVYEKFYFDLDAKQRKAYNEMDKQFRAWLEGDGKVATADLVLTRMLRLAQISCGFIKDDDEEVVAVGNNVRLRALQQVLGDISGHVIIWCRWSWELDEVRKVLGEKNAVYYDGRTKDEERAGAIQRFQREGSTQYFVAKASAAGEGLTLHRAKTVIYMSNTWSLRERLQSEDRAHRAGMDDEPVVYIDIVARDTYDEKVLQALRMKRDTAAIITGDQLTPWA